MATSQRSTHLLIAPSILFPIALLLFALRIYTRWTRRCLGWDDLILSAGAAASTGLFIICTISVLTGIGQHINELEPQQVSRLACLQLFNAEFYVWSATFVKLALAVMLYRIQADHKNWRLGLRAMMIFIVTLAVTCCLWDYLQCRPIRALWDQSFPRNYCSLWSFRKWIYVASALFLVTDVIFAILPIAIVSKIQRPLREKIVLYFLMALGIMCAACVIPKFIALGHYGDRNDFTYNTSGTMFWSQIEVFVGMIAICIPVLKSSAENTMRRMGLLSSNGIHSSRGGYMPASPMQYPKQAITRSTTISQQHAAVDSSDVDDWTWIGLPEARFASKS